jgi:hypothetical protein
MQTPLNLPVAPLDTIRARRQHEALQRVDVGSCGINERLTLDDFAVVGDFVGRAALGGGEGVVGRIDEMLPEVGAAEDDGGVAEGCFEGGRVVEVTGHELDALGFPLLRGVSGGVPGDAADDPAWLVEEDTGD